jgi:hypothetical protein
MAAARLAAGAPNLGGAGCRRLRADRRDSTKDRGGRATTTTRALSLAVRLPSPLEPPPAGLSAPSVLGQPASTDARATPPPASLFTRAAVFCGGAARFDCLVWLRATNNRRGIWRAAQTRLESGRLARRPARFWPGFIGGTSSSRANIGAANTLAPSSSVSAAAADDVVVCWPFPESSSDLARPRDRPWAFLNGQSYARMLLVTKAVGRPAIARWPCYAN